MKNTKQTNNTENEISTLEERQDVTCSEERTELSQSSGSPFDISISLKNKNGEKYIVFEGVFNSEYLLRNTDIDFMEKSLSFFKNSNINISPIFSSNYQSSEKIFFQRSQD